VKKSVAVNYLPGADEPVAVCVLEGHSAVLEQSALLEHLAERCGQAGAMHWLGYFLSGSGARWKRPCLVLFLGHTADPANLRAADVHAAALFYQLSIFGLATGAFSTDDWEGRRTVIAPEGIRSQVTALAVEALLVRTAHVVLATYRLSEHDAARASLLLAPGVVWAEHGREIAKQTLNLEPTYEETLAKFGKRTRRNLRYHRRQVMEKTDCEFVADVCAAMTEEEFLCMNTSSLNPVPPTECMRRYRAARDLVGGFLLGLRDPAGNWLSVLGGWRQGATTVMYFQMNAAGHEKDSLNTVMRGYFLELEVARGTRSVVFYHGTNHSMSRAFEVENVLDLVVRRRSVRARVLRRLAACFVSPSYYGEAPYFRGSTTFFAAALSSHAMEWHAAL
jgi:hypothetical protein